ncbi:unnamed protein product [Tetraodon nigroviridis]|uniref:(spotted green pufferfish) hypothetical protein n=1 Tax=Tetraodon nigroviridis TaxID=99883 RepID=Q4T2T7_TETNG|nr:unnamed protein product [Tetraodon nigroviridis]
MLVENFQVTILKPGSQETATWSEYYAMSHSVVFVVDSADLSRMKETKKTLEKVLSHPFVSGKPVLMIANKQDKKETLNKAEVIEKLRLEGLVNKYKCPCHIIGYSALPGYVKIANEMMKGGQEWLFNVLDLNYEFIDHRVLKDTAAQAPKRELSDMAQLLEQIYESCEGLILEEESPTKEPQSPLWVLESIGSEDEISRGDWINAHGELEGNIRVEPDGYKEGRELEKEGQRKRLSAAPGRQSVTAEPWSHSPLQRSNPSSPKPRGL